MAGRSKGLCHAAAALAILVSSQADAAALWDLSYRNLTQFRKGPARTNQAPIDQYFGAGLSGLPREFSFQTDFRAFADPKIDQRAFDLHQAAFHVEPAKGFSIDGGRIWTVDGFDGEVIDAPLLMFSPPDSHVGGSIFGGIPRYLEEGSFHNVLEGLIVGGDISLKDIKDTAARFSVRLRKIDATRNDWRYNDTIYVGLAFQRHCPSLWATPDFYGDAEADIAGKTLDVGTLGVSLYPHWRLALTIEGSRFDVARRSRERTILGTFFSGSIVQGREAVQVKLMKALHLFQDFSFQRYKVPGRGGENGFTVGSGLDHYWERAKLSSRGEYYFRKSFGGTVHGGYASFSNNYFGHWFADASVDVSRYSKITGQRATAVSVVGDVGYAFTPRTKLALGGEFNRNNWFDREGRVTLNLEIGLDTAGDTPEKRSKRVNRKFHEI